ncbi:MAG: SPOR domain-containing protein [Gammaproteobacteria bacterium]
MKWLSTGVLAILGIAVTLMGGYLFSLQSQIDELHLLLPLEREDPFGPSPSPSLANQAVINNINARIDNLADTLELIAATNQKDNPDIDGLDESPADLTGKTDQQGLAIQSRSPSETTKLPVAQSKSQGSAVADEPRGPLRDRTGPVASAALPARTKGAEKPAEKGEWSVNLMSLAEEAVARKELEKMHNKGVSAEIKPTEVSGKTWYRIRVSGFKTKQQAQHYADSVTRKLGLASTWVTR